VSLVAAGRDHLEAGDGTMATFTDWMRLGDARKTSLATLALGAAAAWFAPESADAAHAATGERSVSDVRISLGEEGRRWTLVPTLLDGRVESFLALREDLAYGENLTAVWYRKVAAADGTESWETKAFEDQDQSKAIRAVKEALALADSTDESWPVAVAAVAAAEPEAMIKGVLESDALAPLVADLEDPQPIVEMLEGAGWKAAWIGPLEGVAVATAEPGVVACPQAVVLGVIERITYRVDDGSAPSISDADLGCIATGWYPVCSSEGTPGPWVPSQGWNCGPWTLERPTQGMGCHTDCIYRRVVSRHRFRKITETNCYTGAVVGTYWQTQYETGSQSKPVTVSGAALLTLVGPGCPLATCPNQPVFPVGEEPTCEPGGDTTEGPWQNP
jgi:hypothetical protein